MYVCIYTNIFIYTPIHFFKIDTHTHIYIYIYQGALLVLRWTLLGALLGASWGTVGACQFDMLKKQESNATAEKQGPAAVPQSRGETLSKQVYLGRV